MTHFGRVYTGLLTFLTKLTLFVNYWQNSVKTLPIHGTTGFLEMSKSDQ